MLVKKLLDTDGMTHWVLFREEGTPIGIMTQYEAVRFAEAVLSEQEDIEQGEVPEDG